MDPQMSEKLKELFETKLNRSMRLYLDTCARCGACVEACHVYQSMPETKYTPVGRAEIIRKLFKRYFKLQGKIAPWLGETIDLDDIGLDKAYEAAFSCTGCRRCVTYCPFGIDTQQVMGIAKLLLIGAEKQPQILSMLSDMSVAKGETWETSRQDYQEAVANLAPEVEALYPVQPGKPAIPLDVQGANVLYVGLSGKHSIVPAAAILNAAKENWTLSYFEAVNFAAWLGDTNKQNAIAKRIIDEATRLGVREVAIVECGTATRVMKFMTGSHPFKVVSIVELIARYLKEGRIKVDSSRFKGSLTYHDPCQLARNGGVMEEPRYIISKLTDNFIELTPNREENWCCGGGGGFISLGEHEFRMKSSKVKADQMKASHAESICTACENCHTQLTELNEHYELGMKVESLTNLVAHALVR
ncbi:MAG: (Fe-S)-binding protein [Spirochaetia bacterium]|nr:(Fe-S)-binding protein [Spirochaetia bacterium]